MPLDRKNSPELSPGCLLLFGFLLPGGHFGLLGLLFCLLPGALFEYSIVERVEVLALALAVFAQFLDAVLLGYAAQLLLLAALALITGNIDDAHGLALFALALLQVEGDGLHLALKVKEEAEDDESQNTDEQQAALIGEVDPVNSRGGLVGIERDALGGDPYLLRGRIACEHQSQVEEALADAGGGSGDEAHQRAGGAVAADAGLPLDVVVYFQV